MRRRLPLALLALGLLAAPAAADAGLAGTHHASRAYLISDGPQAGELMLRVVARYPARPAALGRGPFYGYTEVTVKGPGGTLRLHDLDPLAHPRHAEQVDHRVELSRTRTLALLGAKGRKARLTITTRSVVLGPLRGSGRARRDEIAAAPSTRVAVPLRWVSGYPGPGGWLFGLNSGFRIGYALDPNVRGSYDALILGVIPSGDGATLLTDLTVPGNGLLLVETPGGLPPADGQAFSASFTLTAPLRGGCTGSASGAITGIEADYAGTFDFWSASYAAQWRSQPLLVSPPCSSPISGTMGVRAGTTAFWEDVAP